MKLDKDFQEKFFSYFNSLSSDEFANLIENPTVNVDFLSNVMSFDNISDLRDYYSSSNLYSNYFSSISINSWNYIKDNNHYNSILDVVLSKQNIVSSLNNDEIEEEYTVAANDNRYAIAA